VHRSSLHSSRLHLTPSYLAALHPAAPHFLQPGESRLLQCTTTPAPDSPGNIDYSTLLVILHKDFRSILKIRSATVSKDAATVTIENISSSPFTFHQDNSFGHTCAPPQPLTVPHLLPSASLDLPWSLSSSVAGLPSHHSQSPPTLPPPSTSTPPTLTPSSRHAIHVHYRGSSLLTSPEAHRSDSLPLPCSTFVPKIEKGHFDLWALSLKVLEMAGGRRAVVQVHITSLWLQRPPFTLHILPPGVMEEGQVCLTCSSPHPWSSCPAMAPCTCGDHSRLECSAGWCWVCGGGHAWRTCTNPILTPHQQELAQYGFTFTKEGVTKEGDKVWDLPAALDHLVDVLVEAGTFVAVVGFEVLRCIHILGESVGREGVLERLMARLGAVVDVQWLVPPEVRDRSLPGLCTWAGLGHRARGLRNCDTDANAVASAVKDIISLEMDLGNINQILGMVKEFGIGLIPSDLARANVLCKTEFIPSKLFFTKYTETSNSKLNNKNHSKTMELDSEIEEDDIPRNYVRPIRKKSMKPHLVPELYAGRQETRVVVLALKAVELAEQTYLASLSVRDLEGGHLLDLPAIVPRDFYSEAPGEGDECEACRGPGGKAVLHTASMCPADRPCTLHPPDPSKWPPRHPRRECTGPTCWNCGASHGGLSVFQWTVCPHPILTQVLPGSY